MAMNLVKAKITGSKLCRQIHFSVEQLKTITGIMFGPIAETHTNRSLNLMPSPILKKSNVEWGQAVPRSDTRIDI